MLTPQDISEKRFVKAVFGGYDMPGVDDFLEQISADYSALYKENAKLKGKLKVLVEKVEEYRSTEDAMRMALLTAQRMGEEITVEAARTKEEMLKSADEEVKAKLTEIAKKIAQEEVRLAAASKETTKFLELSQAIIRKHSEFLKKLEDANKTIKPARAPEKAETPARQKSQPDPELSEQTPDNAPITMPTPAPAPIQVTSPEPPQAVEVEVIAQQIGSAVEEIAATGFEPDMPDAVTPVSANNIPPATLFQEEQHDTIEIPVTEEKAPEVTPRPKFDFDDLKFGANFDNDD